MLSKVGLCGVLVFGLAIDVVVCRGMFPGYSGIYGFDLSGYPNSMSAYGDGSQMLSYGPMEEPVKQNKRAYMRLGKRAYMRLGKRSDDQMEADEDSKQEMEKRGRLRLG